jgi:hypothetical protein
MEGQIHPVHLQLEFVEFELFLLPTISMLGSTSFLNRDFWRSNLTVMQKVAFLSGMLYY